MHDGSEGWVGGYLHVLPDRLIACSAPETHSAGPGKAGPDGRRVVQLGADGSVNDFLAALGLKRGPGLRFAGAATRPGPPARRWGRQGRSRSPAARDGKLTSKGAGLFCVMMHS